MSLGTGGDVMGSERRAGFPFGHVNGASGFAGRVHSRAGADGRG